MAPTLAAAVAGTAVAKRPKKARVPTSVLERPQGVLSAHSSLAEAMRCDRSAAKVQILRSQFKSFGRGSVRKGWWNLATRCYKDGPVL